MRGRKPLLILCGIVVVSSALAATLASGRAAVAEPVPTDKGLVSGMRGRDAGVRVFTGIPFAAPPVGSLRWKAPQPARSWEGVRTADRFGPRGMQPTPDIGIAQDPDGSVQPMSEDCLYLNVDGCHGRLGPAAGDRLGTRRIVHGRGRVAA